MVFSGLPGKVCGEGDVGDKASRRREIMAAPLGRDTLPDHWSYGVCRDGRVFFIKWAGFYYRRLFLYEELLIRRIFVVLLSFSNRCLSCSDKTHSTTWLHPRTGEPVNSGHMIRSGTWQIIWFVGYRGDFFLLLQCVFCLWRVVQCIFVRVIDLPRGWEEGFTDEGASYFIKWVAHERWVALFDRVKCDPISWLLRFKV